MAHEVVDVENVHRWELLEDGQLLGYLAYREVAADADDVGDGSIPTTFVRDLQHTVIDPEQRGRGLGPVLVGGVLDDIRARGGRLIPTCPFVRSYLEEHPEQRDLVA